MPSVTADDLGPALVGVFLNAILQGAMGLQACVYFGHFLNDAKWMKALVGFLLFTNSLDTVFGIWWAYDTFVNHFADPSALSVANWIFATNPAMTGIITTMVQIFFAWRIHVLIKNVWLLWFVRVTALGSISCGVGTAVAVRLVPDFLHLHRFTALVIVWFASSVVCDVAITSTLTSFTMRHRTGNIGTDTVMLRLTRLTITNGLLVTLVAIANLVAFLSSTTGVYLLFNFPLAKLYTCSLMSTLNSRIGSQDALSGSSRKASSLAVPTRIQFGRPTSRSVGHEQSHSEVHELSDQKNHTEFSPVINIRPSESYTATTAESVV